MAGATPLAQLAGGNDASAVTVKLSNMFLGNDMPGCIGEVSALLLIL